MCYNLNESAARKCKVNINSSRSDGSVSAFGTVEQAEGRTTVRYTLDGDNCTLTYSNGVAEQNRVGGQNIKITFEDGRKTFCEIASGAFSGGFEVFTKSLKFISGKGGIKLALDYESGTDKERTKLTFTAVYTKQEKK